jgi:hypothetical protein
MSPHQAASGIARKMRGSSGNASVVHCPKNAWIFRIVALPDCPIARKPRGTSGPHQQIQRLTNCGKREKTAWTGRDPQRNMEATRARHHGFGLLLHVKRRDCTHHETRGSGTSSPPASTERDVVVEPALKLAARSHRKDPHTGRLGHSRCRRPIMLTVREAIGMLSQPHIEPSPDLPFAARRTHHACGRTNAGNAAVARQPSAGIPRSTRLTNRASYGPGDGERDIEITTAPRPGSRRPRRRSPSLDRCSISCGTRESASA